MKADQFTQAVRPTVLSQKNFNKIFCVGYNKTGSTTLETVLRLYGFNLPNQPEQELRLTKRVFSTDYTELKTFINHYDAFQDMPFSEGMTYVAADALFPNSRFILSERDPDDWFDSMNRYFRKKYLSGSDSEKITEQLVSQKFNYLFPGYNHLKKEIFLTSFKDDSNVVDWDKLFDRDHYINLYTQRNNQIKKYFSRSTEKLLIIDVTKEKNTTSICEFLNLPKEFVIDMPHLNKS